ncbi:hypothetical protein GHT06_012060 [Daphnia sinensis]|uniref:Uncharacterized protein n=1 Tax=Daphnia sinensis TaxID=1820382 RepID=A0AAD5PYH9_9CRUS|nr:hypothetical protein GHT06_012060 [Daphnia sinensis]
MHSKAAVVITTLVIIAALFIGQTSPLPTTKKALDTKTVNDVTTVISNNKAGALPTSNVIDNKGYIRVSLDDGHLRQLSAFATEEIRLRQKSPDLTLKGVSFALKQISPAESNNYKLTLVLANKGEKRSQFLLCNVDIVHDANLRQAKPDCVRANIVTGIQSIRPDGSFQEDADLAATVFAANEFNRQQGNTSSPLTLLHYVASDSHEMISGTEYKVHVQVMQSSPKDDQLLLCETNVLPRNPRVLHGTECGAQAGKKNSASYSAADVKDADVKETAEFAAIALQERQLAEASDGMMPVKIESVWKKPVRGIERRLRMTLSDDAEGAQPSLYCLAVVFEDRLSGQYELVTGPGNTVCSPTPPTV